MYSRSKLNKFSIVRSYLHIKIHNQTYYHTPITTTTTSGLLSWREALENSSEITGQVLTSKEFLIVPSTLSTNIHHSSFQDEENASRYQYPMITVRPYTTTINKIIDEEFDERYESPYSNKSNSSKDNKKSIIRKSIPIYMYNMTIMVGIVSLFHYQFR